MPSQSPCAAVPSSQTLSQQSSPTSNIPQRNQKVCLRYKLHVLKRASYFHCRVSESGKGKRKAALLPEDGEAPKKRKRITKPKDPNAPKKPASAYLLFQNEVRNELKNQHPNLTNSEILLLISDQWKKMTPDQKGVCGIAEFFVLPPSADCSILRPTSELWRKPRSNTLRQSKLTKVT